MYLKMLDALQMLETISFIIFREIHIFYIFVHFEGNFSEIIINSMKIGAAAHFLEPLGCEVAIFIPRFISRVLKKKKDGISIGSAKK